MLKVATRPPEELTWNLSGGYDVLTERVPSGAMANRQRNLSRAAQPLGFRNHLGQIDSSNAYTTVHQSTDAPTESLAQASSSLDVQQSAYAQYPATTSAATDLSRWPPQATTLHSPHLASSTQYPASDWTRYQNDYQTAAPRRSTRVLQQTTPSIHISTTFDSLDNTQATPVVQYPQAYLAVDNGYSMLYDQQISQMADVAPVSPVSHHSSHSRTGSRTVTPLPEAGRKRSFSEVSQDARSPMITSPGDYAMNEQPAARKSRTVKRSDAPMNADHKYICNISEECAGLVFDRKCEWGKHMDKHDRPYRCPHPSCAKLQGFTYSGGLLRHEREVHNKHGGPKAFLMCPYPSCKRHSEKGFTRKENLHEHIRRVHADTDAELAATTTAPLEQSEPGSTMPTGATADDMYVVAALNGTRKSSSAQPAPGELDELRDQVRRLRTENEAKSAVIQRLEADARAQSDRLAVLEMAMQQQVVP